MTRLEKFEERMKTAAQALMEELVEADGVNPNAFNALSQVLAQLWSAIPNARPPAPPAP